MVPLILGNPHIGIVIYLGSYRDYLEKYPQELQPTFLDVINGHGFLKKYTKQPKESVSTLNGPLVALNLNPSWSLG